MSENAVLNANYLQARLQGRLPDAARPHLHARVRGAGQAGRTRRASRTLDIAKRLMDYGFHPPTIYFPLIVPEALMIEPTETESKETLDAFADAMIADRRGGADRTRAAARARRTTRRVERLDEVKAAKELVLCYAPGCGG